MDSVIYWLFIDWNKQKSQSLKICATMILLIAVNRDNTKTA